MKALLAMTPRLAGFIFDDGQRDRLSSLVDIDLDLVVSDPAALDVAQRSDIEMLITGWGVAPIDRETVEALPALRAIVHWGGAVGFIDPAAAADRGIAISTGRAVNAVPVAEWTVAMIVLAAKEAFWMSRAYAREQRHLDREVVIPDSGLYRTVIGIVGASSVGALVIERLRSYDAEILLFDPFVSPQIAEGLGVELVSDLEALAARASILSIHAPETPDTRGMISRAVLASMPEGSTLINTARGALVDQAALIDEVAAGRLRAILDVTEPDVLPPGHVLYDLPGVFLTPHLAGSTGNELRRLGEAAVAEVERFVDGAGFACPIVP